MNAPFPVFFSLSLSIKGNKFVKNRFMQHIVLSMAVKTPLHGGCRRWLVVPEIRKIPRWCLHGTFFLLIVSQNSKVFEYDMIYVIQHLYFFPPFFFGVNGFEHIIFSFTEVGTRDGMNGRLGVMAPGTMAAGVFGEATWLPSPIWELPTWQHFEVPGCNTVFFLGWFGACDFLCM